MHQYVRLRLYSLLIDDFYFSFVILASVLMGCDHHCLSLCWAFVCMCFHWIINEFQHQLNTKCWMNHRQHHWENRKCSPSLRHQRKNCFSFDSHNQNHSFKICANVFFPIVWCERVCVHSVWFALKFSRSTHAHASHLPTMATTTKKTRQNNNNNNNNEEHTRNNNNVGENLSPNPRSYICYTVLMGFRTRTDSSELQLIISVYIVHIRKN